MVEVIEYLFIMAERVLPFCQNSGRREILSFRNHYVKKSPIGAYFDIILEWFLETILESITFINHITIITKTNGFLQFNQ